MPPRRIAGHRALSIALRTVHLATFGAVLGGHLFDVAPARLGPLLAATVLSGILLVALELASSCAWLLEGRGLAVLAKLGVLALVPSFPDQRVPLLLLVVAIASVGSHMPGRFRHRSAGPLLAEVARRLLPGDGTTRDARGQTRGAPPRRVPEAGDDLGAR